MKQEVRVREVGGLFYVYLYDKTRYQCQSVPRSDPKGGGHWFMNGEMDSATEYVGHGYRKRQSAMRYARLLRQEQREGSE